jgi:hypothetical protein
MSSDKMALTNDREQSRFYGNLRLGPTHGSVYLPSHINALTHGILYDANLWLDTS